jgi:hypothetical protein
MHANHQSSGLRTARAGYNGRARTPLIFRAKLGLVVAVLPWVATIELRAQYATAEQSAPAQAPVSALSTSLQEEKEIMKDETAGHDRTYLKSRIIFRYDYKSQVGDVFFNRFRLKCAHAFGQEKHVGVAMEIPVVFKDTPTADAAGLSEVRATFRGVPQSWEHFRHGAGVEFALQTSTRDLLGEAPR